MPGLKPRWMLLLLACAVIFALRAEEPSGKFMDAVEPAEIPAGFEENPADVPGLTYSAYAPTTFRALHQVDEADTFGVRIFNTKRRAVLTLPGYPESNLTERDKMRIDACAVTFPAIRGLLPAYTHKLPIRIAGNNFLLLFQTQVVPYLPREVEIGEDVILYFFHSDYSDFDKTHLLLVTEFHRPFSPSTLKMTAERWKRAEQLYASSCSVCHGSGGKGDGPAGAALKPSPGDLTNPAGYKNGATLENVIETIRYGVDNGRTGMVGGLVRNEMDRAIVARYILARIQQPPKKTPETVKP